MDETLTYIGHDPEEFLSIILGQTINAEFIGRNFHFVMFDYNNMNKIGIAFTYTNIFEDLKKKWVIQYQNFLQDQTKLF